MHSAWFRSIFVRVLKFVKIKEGGDLISGWEAILQKVKIIWSPVLSFNCKSFKHSNSSSFIRYQWFLYDSGVPFSGFWNLSKLKRERGVRNFRGNQFSRKSELLGSPSVFQFQEFKYPNEMPSAWFSSTFSRVLKFSQIKEGGGGGDLIPGGNQFCRKSELFGPLFCSSTLNILWTQILCDSLDFNTFFMVQQYFSNTFKICTN